MILNITNTGFGYLACMQAAHYIPRLNPINFTECQEKEVKYSDTGKLLCEI